MSVAEGLNRQMFAKSSQELYLIGNLSIFNRGKTPSERMLSSQEGTERRLGFKRRNIQFDVQ